MADEFCKVLYNRFTELGKLVVVQFVIFVNICFLANVWALVSWTALCC